MDLCEAFLMPILNKDMQLCISLAARPSNLGTRFHNFLYDELGLNFIYKAFSTNDLEGAVRAIRALGIRGCSVSMPHKESIIQYLDQLEDSATAIESVNTVVNENGILIGSNTDFQAVHSLIQKHKLDSKFSVLVRGSGGMAKAVVAAFNRSGFENLTIHSRNQSTGRALANKFGYVFDETSLLRPGFEVIVNVTPIGMSGENEPELSFPADVIAHSKVVFDVVAFPSETPLVLEAISQNKQIISGAEVIALQAGLQFEKYTGVKITKEQIARASEFSRS